MWISGLGFILENQKVTGLIPGQGAHAWVAGLVPDQDACERQLIDVSFPLVLPPSPLSKNK